MSAAQARKRSLGNIRFIGFLFVQKLLSERIMHTCIQQLLTNVRLASCSCGTAMLLTMHAWLLASLRRPHSASASASARQALTCKVSTQIRCVPLRAQ